MSPLQLTIVTSASTSETSSSSICRAYLAVETLRERKLAAGSWAVLTSASKNDAQRSKSAAVSQTVTFGMSGMHADLGQFSLLRLCRRKVLLPSYGRQSTSTPKVSSKDLSELSIHAELRFMIAIQLSSSHLKSFVDANKVIVTPIDANQDIVKVAKSIRLEMEPSTTKKLVSTGDDAEREEKWTEAVIRERLSE